MFKETLFLTIEVIIILLAFLISLSYIANLIGSAQVYSDQEKRTQLNICLEKGVPFQECYHGVYNQYVNFKGKE